MQDKQSSFDYVVIGSGFGGSVSAMRLSEKGYSVAVIEQGRDFKDKDFPKTNWNVKNYLWLPLLHFFGFQKMSVFKDVLILSGTGVGGGSLVYANTHMTPPDTFFSNPQWSRFNQWKTVLKPFYDKARFMLGSAPAPSDGPEDKVLKEIANDMGRGDSFHGVDVGVYFGDPKEKKDPYFKGQGPERSGCTLCAGCMVGCRFNAKNTLPKNYLYFAKKFGAKIFAQRKVDRIEYKDGEYLIHTFSMKFYPFKLGRKTFKSKGLVVSAGVLGTLKLLFDQKHVHKTLPNLSSTLGESVRTNSESLLGVVGPRGSKYNNGVAISSVFNPDDDTHIEIVKYPDKSSAMKLLAGPAVDKGHPLYRLLQYSFSLFFHPVSFFKQYFGRNWATRSVILLVMQSLDNSMKMTLKRFPFRRLSFDNKSGNKVPAYIDIGQKVMYKYAEKIGGRPSNAFTEVSLNMSSTAHILGGLPMGEDAEEGVISPSFEVHHYPNMYVLDGSIIQGNLGVNPSLTITSLSEYAMSLVPAKEGNQQKSLDELMGK
jgi:cholesterol oxidase